MIALTRSQQFEASLVPRNAAALRLELWLGIFLVPVFWALDWFVVPDQVWLTLPIRLLCTAIGLSILLREQLAPGWIARHVGPLAFSFSLLVGW